MYKKQIRSKMIDANTSLFCLIGNPVAHSLSPQMHNQAFAAAGYNAVYLAFRVSDPGAAISAVRALNFKGVSVTLPHKVRVMEHLDEIEEVAVKIGAVNTIVNNRGKLTGYNTDCAGAIEALKTQTTIADKSIALIGAGGAARAIGFGLVTAGGRVTVLNRSRTTGEQLAADLEADFLPLSEWAPEHYEVLINTTPVGMHPDIDATPVPPENFSEEMVVMDIVYNPLKTSLLQAAEDRGCQTINGVAMFVFQGASQFELWTGRKAPVDVMQGVVLEALNE